MIQIQFMAGTPIEMAAQELCSAAEEHGEATGTFNDIELFAARGFAPAGIVSHFNDECARRREAWLKSPAGLAAEREREERRSRIQGAHDALMRRLPRLDMSDAHAVLDWLCGMQEPSDHEGVIVQRQTIVSKFEAAGYRANENTGDDYREGDRNNMFRYLVGQALAGLKEGPAIHGIIHKFADQWRRQFPAKQLEPLNLAHRDQRETP